MDTLLVSVVQLYILLIVSQKSDKIFLAQTLSILFINVLKVFEIGLLLLLYQLLLKSSKFLSIAAELLQLTHCLDNSSLNNSLSFCCISAVLL